MLIRHGSGVREWQEAEKAVEEDIKQGRVSKIFSTSEEGITYLRKKRKRATHV